MPIHILHLHSTFNHGGKEARAVRLMNAFGDKARHTIVSAMPDQLGARDAIAKGIKYEIAQNPPPLSGRPSVKRYEEIARFMRRFDLVLTYNWGAIDGVMAARVFGKGLPPIVHHEDGFNQDEAERLNPVRNMYRRIALPAANALVVPSQVLERVAIKHWRQPAARVHRIANGVPTALFAQKPDPTLIPQLQNKREGEVFVGCVAGLRPVKDLPMLIRAIAGVNVRFKLVILGEGPERQNIVDAAEAMAIEDQVILPGFLPEPHRYMGLFDLFALSSKSEQAPISVIEAMAAGLPVVSTRVGDIPSMVSPENAPFLAPRHHEVDLRDRIDTLARHPDSMRHIGEQNRARARALFDEAQMIASYARLYGEAMGRPDALQ
ncbi:glycosyltransferase involved in cell wall biosynthesis [Sphingomonas naasensis]|uniref:Glycosyltransferase family 1 protein n=1 Tax=Sphingomonas naasensis TaxID=1344951 RepID=A0A4S1WX36_9SPHN|nr:glycosyltransferase family 4 protein [Sphingomonas naasensis]NIJ18951.1 glycosyltransferase involved in cell wall biosynthesis [Sphingomonas naasensis]TGX46166.1 glycosyltransferase family 1 protein [Sphingomonas naasensis]